MESRRGFLPANDPGLVQLQSEIRILQQVLAELQSGFHYFSAQTITQEELPRVMANYFNLRRDLQIQEDNYLRLRGQYELTRIEETNPSRTFQVIEAVEVPETKHKPSRSQVSMVGIVIAFLLSVLLTFFLEYLARVRADPTEAAKLAAIREQLGGRSRAACWRLAGPPTTGAGDPFKPTHRYATVHRRCRGGASSRSASHAWRLPPSDGRIYTCVVGVRGPSWAVS